MPRLVNPALMRRIHHHTSRAYARNRYENTTCEECRVCGTLLETNFNEPLSRYFTMDIQGHFYCTECDKRFEDGDERIYVPEEDV